MRRPRAAVAAFAGAVAALTVAAGCGADPAPDGADSPLADHHASDSPPAALRWSEAGSFARGEEPALASQTYVAVLVEGGTTLELRNRADGEVVLRHRSPAGFHVNDVFLEAPHLVVVDAHDQEEEPDRPVVIDVPGGKERRLGADAPAPVTGTWAVGDGRLLYNTAGDDGGFCLAEADLATLTGAVVDCVARRHGIMQVSTSPYGLAYTTFDDQRPMACLTPLVRRDGDAAPVAGGTRCRVWEAVAADDDAVVWSVVTRPRQIERGEFFARVGDGRPVHLGTGLTGSLTWCGDAAWFTRYGDDDEPGALLRWTPAGGLDEAFRLRSTAGVLSAPLCGGDTVAVAESRGGPTVLHTAPVTPRRG